jgi:hypothetical protein
LFVPPSRFSQIFFDALVETGLPIGDLNGEREDEGVFYPQVTLDRGWRVGTFRQFAVPQLKSGRLQVVSLATVTKINFEGNRAVGEHLSHCVCCCCSC